MKPFIQFHQSIFVVNLIFDFSFLPPTSFLLLAILFLLPHHSDEISLVAGSINWKLQPYLNWRSTRRAKVEVRIQHWKENTKWVPYFFLPMIRGLWQFVLTVGYVDSSSLSCLWYFWFVVLSPLYFFLYWSHIGIPCIFHRTSIITVDHGYVWLAKERIVIHKF